MNIKKLFFTAISLCLFFSSTLFGFDQEIENKKNELFKFMENEIYFKKLGTLATSDIRAKLEKSKELCKKLLNNLEYVYKNLKNKPADFKNAWNEYVKKIDDAIWGLLGEIQSITQKDFKEKYKALRNFAIAKNKKNFGW